MEFDEYLKSKKIEAARFAAQEPGRYADWKAAYGQMHPESFTTAKKFLINEVRRRYRITD